VAIEESCESSTAFLLAKDGKAIAIRIQIVSSYRRNRTMGFCMNGLAGFALTCDTEATFAYTVNTCASLGLTLNPDVCWTCPEYANAYGRSKNSTAPAFDTVTSVTYPDNS
jgi:hypothetical protein